MAIFNGTKSFTATSNIDDGDNAAYQLFGVEDVEVVQVAGRTFMYVTGKFDSGLTVFEVNADGTTTFVQSIADTAALALNGAHGIESVTLGANTYVYISGIDDNGVSAFQVGADGTLTHVQTQFDTAGLALEFSTSAHSVSVGGNDFLVVAGRLDNGVSVFQIAQDGTFTATDTQFDIGGLLLRGAKDITTAVVNGTTYVYVTGDLDDGITIFSLDAAGALTFVSTLADDGTLELDGASGIETVTVGGNDFIVVGGFQDDGLSVFSVGAGGALTNVANVADNGTNGLNGPQGFEPIVIDGQTYLVVSGQVSSAVSLYSMAANGALQQVATQTDDGTLKISATRGLDVFDINGTSFAAVAGLGDRGVSVFRIDDVDDVFNGTGDADTMNGLGGNDTLNGAAGTDLLVGGAGNDTVNGGDDADVLFWGAGNDAFDGGAGIDYVTYAIASQVRINLADNTLNAFDAAGDTYTNVEAFFLSGGNDSFTGDAANNFVFGQDGNDTIIGGGGGDIIYGEDGDDFIESGAISDIISGGAGADTFYYSLNQIEADTILDFVSGTDMFAFEQGGFNLFAGTTLTDGVNFFSTTSGAGANYNGPGTVFIYHTDTGALFADTDGDGVGAANLIATLGANTTLVASDLTFVNRAAVDSEAETDGPVLAQADKAVVADLWADQSVDGYEGAMTLYDDFAGGPFDSPSSDFGPPPYALAELIEATPLDDITVEDGDVWM